MAQQKKPIKTNNWMIPASQLREGDVLIIPAHSAKIIALHKGHQTYGSRQIPMITACSSEGLHKGKDGSFYVAGDEMVEIKPRRFTVGTKGFWKNFKLWWKHLGK